MNIFISGKPVQGKIENGDILLRKIDLIKALNLPRPDENLGEFVPLSGNPFGIKNPRPEGRGILDC